MDLSATISKEARRHLHEANCQIQLRPWGRFTPSRPVNLSQRGHPFGTRRSRTRGPFRDATSISRGI